MTSSTPGAARSASISERRPLLPMAPMMVRSAPCTTCAWKPHSLIRSMMWLISSGVAVVNMLTIMIVFPLLQGSWFRFLCGRGRQQNKSGVVFCDVLNAFANDRAAVEIRGALAGNSRVFGIAETHHFGDAARGVVDDNGFEFGMCLQEATAL